MKKNIFKFAAIFGLVGFIAYILIIVSSFFSCCFGLESILYNKIILSIFALEATILLIFVIKNCFKK